jgi:multiple sugar transport system permease protein
MRLEKTLSPAADTTLFPSKSKASSMKRNKTIADIVTYALLILGAFTMLYPFWWMLAASFSDRQHVLQIKFLPLVWDFTNYGKALDALGGTVGPGYMRAIINTLLYATVPVVVGTFVSALAAFAFAKINFVGKNVVFLILLAAIMIPFPSIMMQQFYLYSRILKWNTGPLVMIVPRLFGNIMIVFFIRQFLLGLPTAIIESAKIDGASYPRIFFVMILPLAAPAIVAQGVLAFMGSWNDYLAPRIFISAKEWFPVSVSLAEFGGGLQSPQQVVMAGAVMALVPVLILFGIFQKRIIESVMLSGSKE